MADLVDVDAAARTARPPDAGSFTDGHGIFFGEDRVGGIPISVRFDWHALGDGAARWAQAFSFDDGRTWATNWIMEFTRTTGD